MQSQESADQEKRRIETLLLKALAIANRSSSVAAIHIATALELLRSGRGVS